MKSSGGSLAALAVAIGLLVATSAHAALPHPLPATLPASAAVEDSLLQHAVDDLSLRADLLEKAAQLEVRVVNVAAHPDDEDGQTLTVLRHAYGYQTHILYMTRGEGGQNEVGPELGDDLGRLRSLECQGAAEAYGATISFLNCADFGYSKTAKESLARWGEQATLVRLMGELRLLDADIVITHHTPWEGHGHHRATSILLRQACRELQRLGDRAAPAVLLELTADPDSATVSVDASGAAPGVPWSYAGLAHVALRRHVTQGMALGPIPHGPAVKRYRAVDGVGDARVIRHWAGMPDPWAAAQARQLVGQRPLQSARALQGVAARLRSGAWYRLDTSLLSQPDDRPIVPEHEPAEVELGRIRLSGPGAQSIAALRVIDQRAHGFRITIIGRTAPAEVRVAAVSTTWHSLAMDAYLRTRRSVADSLELQLRFHDGHTERRSAALPACLRPELGFPAPVPYAVPGHPVRLSLRRAGFDGMPRRWLADLRASDPRLHTSPVLDASWRSRESTALGLRVETTELVLAVPEIADGSIDVALTGSGDRERAFSVVLPVVAPEIPPAARVAMIAGADSALGRQLEACGVALRWASQEDLAHALPIDWNTLIVDARAYALHPWLRSANARLLDWVRTGGHLVVLMHKSFDWQRGDSTASDLPPLPLHVGGDRVCEEDAPVTILAAQHRFFHFPHQLDAATWTGWHQERGLYYPDAWDPAFTPLLRMSDTDEPPLDSGILCARVGRGAYTYTCLAWGRQLREAHPGALLAFINLLSWPLAPTSN